MHIPADFADYWQHTMQRLARFPARPELDLLPLRCTDFATLYAVRLTSLGPYRLFGYLSIPQGPGPFPAIYYAPKYQSVLEIIPQGTANRQRSKYITLALAARGGLGAAEQAQLRFAIRLAHLPELRAPHVFGVGEHGARDSLRGTDGPVRCRREGGQRNGVGTWHVAAS